MYLYIMYVWYFFVVFFFFSGWNSVLKDFRKYSKCEFGVFCIEVRVKCILLRFLYFLVLIFCVICFILRSSKFYVVFFLQVFVLFCFVLLKFMEEISFEYFGMYWVICVISGKICEEKILVNCFMCFFYFVLFMFYFLMVICVFFLVWLFWNMS